MRIYLSTGPRRARCGCLPILSGFIALFWPVLAFHGGTAYWVEAAWVVVLILVGSALVAPRKPRRRAPTPPPKYSGRHQRSAMSVKAAPGPRDWTPSDAGEPR